MNDTSIRHGTGLQRALYIF